MTVSARPRNSQAFVDQVYRERIMRAAATVVARQGFAATTVDHLVAEAGIARNTFYHQFRSKADCLEATLAWATAEAGRRMEAAAVGDGHPEDRVTVTLAALLCFLAEAPALARVYLVDGPAISPALLEQAEERFAQLLAPAPGVLEDLLVAGVTQIVRRHVIQTPDEDPRNLLGDLRDFVLGAYGAPAPGVLEAVPA